MKDIFLKSDTKSHMLEDLESVCSDFVVIDEDGEEQFASGHGFAICYCGVLAKPGTGETDEEGNVITPMEFYDGVHCNARVWGKYENIFDGFSSENTKMLYPETPCIVFG